MHELFICVQWCECMTSVFQCTHATHKCMQCWYVFTFCMWHGTANGDVGGLESKERTAGGYFPLTPFAMCLGYFQTVERSIFVFFAEQIVISLFLSYNLIFRFYLSQLQSQQNNLKVVYASSEIFHNTKNQGYKLRVSKFETFANIVCLTSM